MKLTSIFAGLGASTFTCSVFAVPVYDPATNTTYIQTATNQTWTAAEASAVASGTHLVHIHNAAENGLVRTAAGGGNAWIGATDQAVEGEWRWIDDGTQFWMGLAAASGGTPVGGQYSNWNGGEPNDSNGEDYAQIGGSNWNDLPAASTLPGILKVSGNQAAQTFNGHTYYLVAPANNATAESQAVALGGHLVRIDDAAENAFVQGLLDDTGETTGWIGGSDQAVDGEWRWRDGAKFWQGSTNGSALLYTNWNSGEPNGGTNENFAQMYVNGVPANVLGTWNDGGDGNLYSVVEVVPEPGLAGLLVVSALFVARRRRP